MSVSPISLNSSTLAQASKTVSNGPDRDSGDSSTGPTTAKAPDVDPAQRNQIRADAAGVGAAVNVTA